VRLLRAREIQRLSPSTPRTPKFKSETQRIAHSAVIEAIKNGELEVVEVGCPVCEGQEFEHVASIDRQGIPVQTVRCVRCPTLYSRQRFTDVALNTFYSSYYRDLYGGVSSPNQEWFESQVESGRKILRSLLMAGVIPDQLDGLRVLEVGSAAGGVLAPFREEGATVLGVDFDENYLKFGRSKGIDLRIGGVNDVPAYGVQDIVILKDVLEHLPDPVRSLELVRSVLSDRGVIYIQVPGLQALEFLGYGNDLLRYLQIAHLCHYTKQSLEYLCQKAGLRVLHSESRGIVICGRESKDGGALTPICPGPEDAITALENIYRHRRTTAIRHKLQSRTPESMKHLAKKLIR